MCGISGTLRFDGSPVDPVQIAAHSELLAHRGPDGKGLWLSDDARVGLAHRRLAIIDVTPAGQQPMLSVSGEAVITYNGEIFNYRELRSELERMGTSFRSWTDTEVILAAYQRWGQDCVLRFNGMWSFALWDLRSRELFCSRDRLGIKPFYYHLDHCRFHFASEIKALLSSDRIERRADPESVYDYLNFSRKDHGSNTFVKGIYSLPPGHNLTIDRAGRSRLNRYWTLPTTRPPIPSGSSREIAAELCDLVRDAVRIHLRADVPTGICLSGGLDSSTITILASELLRAGLIDRKAVSGRLRTYTSHFPGQSIDETAFARAVVEASGAEPSWITPSSDRLFEEMDALMYHLEEPFVSTSMYAQWCVIRRAAEDGIKVLLDGQGADEVFGGYPPYYGVFLLTLLGEGKVFEAAREGWLFRTRGNPHPWTTAASEFARLLYARLPASARRFSRRRVRAVGDLMQPDFISRQQHRDRTLDVQPRRLRLEDRLLDDTVSTNLPSLLRYEDRISMAFGIEARLPLLDYRIVEMAFSLPATYKFRDGWSKWILREAMRERVPEVVRLRRDKLGFPTPQVEWLTARAEWISELFQNGGFRAGFFLNGERIARRVPDLLKSSDDTRELWRCLCLELWMRRFHIDAP